MKKSFLIWLCSVFLLLPKVCAAKDDVLLGRDEVTAKIRQTEKYQLLDARNATAQRDASIAFSTKYRKTMAIKKGLVLIVADTDTAAVEIARSISSVPGRSVFAVQGGAETWRQVAAEASPPAMPDSFVIPMNTCEQGKPLQELRRNQPRPNQPRMELRGN